MALPIEFKFDESAGKSSLPSVFEAANLETLYKQVEAEVSAEVPDVETVEGRKRIKSLAANVASSKTAIDKPIRDYLRAIKEQPKLLEKNARESCERFDALKAKLLAPLEAAQAAQDAILERLLGLHPKIIDLSLDRMLVLLDDLGNPQNSLPPVVHIAGTNGKGSTQAMIRAGLEAAGKRVHAYTSPHLARFHERIRLAGDLIPEDQLSAILTEIEDVNAGRPITFFELTTAAAFLAFARTPADYTLLEVGLGGRLDATNVVADPALTIITPVSIDHTQYLGETLPEIAGEKAGILKRLVPVIVARQQDEALAVIETRAEVGLHHVAPHAGHGRRIERIAASRSTA